MADVEKVLSPVFKARGNVLRLLKAVLTRVEEGMGNTEALYASRDVVREVADYCRNTVLCQKDAGYDDDNKRQFLKTISEACPEPLQRADAAFGYATTMMAKIEDHHDIPSLLSALAMWVMMIPYIDTWLREHEENLAAGAAGAVKH